MKKTFHRLILAVVLMVIIIIVIIALRPKLVAVNDSADVLNIKDARAQSYAADKSPEFVDGDWVFGSSGAVVRIFVYEDYSNPYSAVLADTLDKIRSEFKKQTAIIVRPYVLENSAFSFEAALAMDCAAEQGNWEEMRTILFNQVKNQQAAAANINEYAEQAGLNKDKFSACLTNNQKSGKIEQAEADAVNYGVQGAPTIFIGDEMILGARPYGDFIDSNGDKIEGLRTVIMKKLEEAN